MTEYNITGTYRHKCREADEGNEEMSSQAAHLPRKAPKDTLPMPVANIQKQKKRSRNKVSAGQRLAVNRETERDKVREERGSS